MVRLRAYLIQLSVFWCCVSMVHAQTALQTTGALIVVPALGEVMHANDEAHITFMVEEQDKDKSIAASPVNQKKRQGIDIIRHEAPQATLKTRGYYTYPVYAEDTPVQANRTRKVVRWRVGQYLEMTTTDLTGLPKTVAAAQRIFALSGLQFGLSDVTGKKLDEQLIQAAYANLTQRIAAIAKAMGRTMSDVVIDTVDFEGSGAYAQQPEATAGRAKMAMLAEPADARQIEEPSFEPGETTTSMRVVGKFKFR